MKLFLVRITAKTYKKLRELDRYHLDLKKRSARQESESKFVVSGIVNEEEIEKLKKMDYKLEVLLDLSKEGKERREEVSKTNRFVSTKGISDVKKSIFGGYMNTDEVDYALVHLSNLHPDIVTVIELPYKTCEGRVCKAIKLSTSKNDLNNRIGILLTGSMHAREWGGSDICIGFLTNVIDSFISNTPVIYGSKTFTSTQIKNMLDLADLFVFPNVNPDGKIYSQSHDNPTSNQQGVWWRKNRNPSFVPNGDDPNHRTGVDINRNFNFLWNSGIGTINEIDGKNMSETYKGRAAFSEPETRNVNYLFDTFRNIQYYVDIHSYGGMILYSWGDDKNQSKDPRQNFINPEFDGVRGNPTDTKYKEFIQKTDENQLLFLANRMHDSLAQVRGSEYKVQQSVGLYPTSGTSDDYAFSRNRLDPMTNKLYGFTIEFGKEETGFIPSYPEMQNIIKDISAGLTEFCIAVSSS